MSGGTRSYEIEFPEGYFGQLEEDTPSRGWIEVTVAFEDGQRCQLAFYDIVRLKQTLDDYVEQGFVHFAEPHLVVLTRVSTENVRKAVADMVAEGYFDAVREQ